MPSPAVVLDGQVKIRVVRVLRYLGNDLFGAPDFLVCVQATGQRPVQGLSWLLGGPEIPFLKFDHLPERVVRLRNDDGKAGNGVRRAFWQGPGRNAEAD
jgi:hypothetical protein